MSEAPLASLTDEGRRIAALADAAGLTLRVTGGVGVALTCSSARTAALARTYSDIDVVGHGRQRGAIIALMSDMGYVPDAQFNALHGARRLYFWDGTNERQLDIFLDKVEMCHVIDLRERLRAPGPALSAADLLLMKLQIVESNEKDLRDIVCLLTDQDFTDEPNGGIELPYLAGLAAADWGLWRTVTMVAERAESWARGVPALASSDRVRDQVSRFLAALEEMPKSRAWRLRAKVGDRKRWYLLPEEAH